MYRIKEIGKKHYEVQVEAGQDPFTGKRKRITRRIKGRKPDAERAAVEIVKELEEGTYVSPSGENLADYLKEWFAIHQTNLAPKTAETYHAIINKHLIPALGQVKLQNLQPMDLQSYYSKAVKQLSKRSVEQHHAVLSRAFKDALKWRKVNIDPTTMVSVPRPDRKTAFTMSAQQENALLQVIKGHELENLIIVAMYSGLRMGEILALRWHDVDLGECRLRVTQTVSRVNGENVIRQTGKTKKSNREIYLPEIAVSALKRQKEKAESIYVFPGKDGQPRSGTVVSHSFKRLARKAGIEMRFHDLRHAYATRLRELGLDMKIIQESLGHEDVSTTGNIYSHVNPGMQKQVAKKLNGHVSKCQKNVRKTHEIGSNRKKE